MKYCTFSALVVGLLTRTLLGVDGAGGGVVEMVSNMLACTHS